MAVGATSFLVGLLDTLSPNLHTLPLPWVDPFKPLTLRDIAQVPDILSFLRLQIFGFLFTLQLPHIGLPWYLALPALSISKGRSTFLTYAQTLTLSCLKYPLVSEIFPTAV